MKHFMIGLLVLGSMSALAVEKPEKILCQVGNQNALKGPGFRNMKSDKNIPSETVASIRLGNWSEYGFYAQTVSEALQYGLVVETEEQLKALQNADSDLRALTGELSFSTFLETQKEYPHGVDIRLRASLTDKGVKITYDKRINTFNLSSGLFLAGSEAEEKIAFIPYSNLEAPAILEDVAISCKSVLVKSKQSYQDEIKRLKEELKKM